VKLLDRNTFRGRAARALLVTVLLMLLMQFLEYKGMLAGPEGAVLDTLLRVENMSVLQPLITIEIDDAAYGACFDAVSPLDPDAVFALVDGVRSAGPAVLGVDILTEAEKNAKRYQELAGKFSETAKTAVWIAGAEDPHFDVAPFPLWLIGHEDHLVVRPTRVLGFQAAEAEEHGIRWGVPVFPRDADQSLRRFPRTVELSADPKSGFREEALSWARILAGRYCAGRSDCRIPEGSVHGVYIPYALGPQRRINMLDLFKCPGRKRVEIGGRLWGEFQEMAKGRIVLIGGNFSSARHSYETPIGRIPGLLVNAYAVLAEINGSGIREHRLHVVFFDIGVGLVVAWIAWLLRRRPMRAMMTATMAWLIVALVITYTLFGRGYVLSFAGLVVGMLLHQMYEVWHLNPKAEGH
jgi:CHASE2 domain-containing sensor protein